MSLRNILIIAALLAAYAYASNNDYCDDLLAHGQTAPECKAPQ